MEVLSPKSRVWISYLEEGAERQGFECEHVFLIDETRGDPSSTNPILDDIENYDGMVLEHSSRGKRGHHKRWKKLIQAILPTKRQGAAKQKGETNKKNKDYGSDASIATASTRSVESRTSLEGFVITTSKALEDHDSETLDPNVLNLLSEIALDKIRDKHGTLGSTESDTQKAHDLVFDEAATACTIRSESSSLSSHSSDSSKAAPSLMERRLLDTGLVKRGDFDFVADFVSKEVLHLAEEKKDDEYDATQDKNVAHVKTGIWEVTSLEDDGTPRPPYYIVTGVSMDDRVDTKKLRKFVFAGQEHTRRPKLAMAPAEIAEVLAGYKSGTMAPICHTKGMQLFLEESLVKDVDRNTHKLNVGSGMFGKCLSISAKHFLEIAKSNPKGLEICPIIRKTNK